MQVLDLHPWDVDYHQAVSIQNELRGRVQLQGEPGTIRRVAGADVSFSKATNRVYAAVVLYDLERKEAVEVATASGRSTFPYIPGLLSFREAPILLRAFQNLRTEPDVVILDGQGIAHPRRFGLASHIGLLLDLPSIGCAKTKLVGEYQEPEPERGSASPLLHHGEEIGLVLRTKKGVKPVFVSVGHKISLKRAADVVLACCTHFRLPEPTRLAHLLTNRLRTQQEKS